MSTRGTSLPRNADWRDQADCRRLGHPELWFPKGTTGRHVLQADEAKAFCRECPVAKTCARWALDRRIDNGVWGGLDEQQRRSILRETNPSSIDELIRAAWNRDISGPLVDTYLSRTEQEDGGHVRWTRATSSNFSIASRYYTPRQLAFEVGHGRRPVGIVRTACGRATCVAAEHLTDETIRMARDPYGLAKQAA